MKVIKYNLCTRVNRGTKEKPEYVEILSPVTMNWNERNEEIAKREAYEGKYTITDENDRPETIRSQIESLKRKLSNTDYCILKVVEGAATLADYAETIAKRKNWRKQINDLESKISKLKGGAK